MLIKTPRDWEIPESEATPESVFLNRRQILKAAGFLGMTGLLQAAAPYPAKRNPDFTLDRAVTPEFAATGYNNYYEFADGDHKEQVKDRVGAFKTSPWKVEVAGLCNNPETLDLDDLLKTMQFEERLYRFRCVEAWSMAVPWTGFKMADLIRRADPKPEARYVRFVTANRPGQMPGMKEQSWYPWPYFEGLRMDEARNELAMFVTGVYGKALPVQNGAPIRVITPWKYGYKSIKSVVRIEFVRNEPKTFWNEIAKDEYGFYSNVNPNKPHPRWSQRIERVIPNMRRVPTLMYNGYEKWVSGMYNGNEF